MREIRQIRLGHLFLFPDMPGVIWIKCRGGYRHALGGPLHACAPHVAVRPYDPAAPSLMTATSTVATS